MGRASTCTAISGLSGKCEKCTSPAPFHRFSPRGGPWNPYGTAQWALFNKAKAKKAETLLVHGASGGVGTAAVQFSLAAGLKVIGTAGSEEGLKLVKEQGAHLVLNHKLLTI